MSGSANDAVSVAFDALAVLGECPIWSASRSRLLWVDTLSASLNLFDPATATNQVIETPAPLGFVAEDHEGSLIVGMGCDIARIDDRGAFHKIARAPHARNGYRLNDARFDARGRLWVGWMDEALSDGSGRLYRFDADGSWRQCDAGFTLINGLDWSRDSRTLYVTDSRKGHIYAYDYGLESGAICNRRVFVNIDPTVGKPDGLLVDAQGYLLSVLFDGSAITRIAPDGTIDRMIELPVPRPTSCAFSDDGQTLFVTSARLDLSKDALEKAPASGGLLRVDYVKAVQ